MPFYAPIGKEQRLQQAALPFLTCEEKTENHSGPGEFRLPEGECMRDNNDCLIRLARPDDAAALLEIYAPYVRDTAITFEYTPPSEEEFQRRILSVEERYPYLVAEQHGRIAGYAPRTTGMLKRPSTSGWTSGTMDSDGFSTKSLKPCFVSRGLSICTHASRLRRTGTAACLGTVRLFTNPTATPLLAVFAAVVTNSGAGTTLSGWKNPLESTRLI